MAWFSDSRRALALALQGGGAHGAFTWGVLDRLLEEERLVVEAISGASAGAMNAMALAQGWVAGGAAGARAALRRFWTAVGTQLPFDAWTTGPAQEPALAPGLRWLMHCTQLLAPHQFNPLGLDPLRDVLARTIDFEALRDPRAPRLFVAATHANSGRLRLFRNRELTLDAALASACLPTLHPAVLIDGEPYWDGGYSANPALFPLVRAGCDELLIVALAPLLHARAPRSAAEIRARALEFTFNAGFLREAQLLAEACEAARAPAFALGSPERRLRRLRLHLIDADEALAPLHPETRLIAHRPFLEHLHGLGRARAQRWLVASGDRLGRTSTVDLRQLLAAPA